MGDVGQTGEGKPVRSMADIARMFLDGVRPVGGAAPKRVPPGGKGREETERVAEVRAEGACVRLAICGGAEGWGSVVAAAVGIAEEQSTTVGVIGMMGGKCVMEVAGVESVEELPAVKGDGAGVDMQIARALFTLREAVGMWVLAAPSVGTAEFGMVAGRVRDWVMVCPTDNDGLVGAYREMKRAAAVPSEGRKVEAVMVGEDHAEAAAVHGRLRRAAKEFLGTELPLLVSVLRGAGGKAVRVASFEGAGMGSSMGAWAAVLDELMGGEVEEEVGVHEAEAAVERVAVGVTQVTAAAFDELAHVLDPEERAALGAELGEEVGRRKEEVGSREEEGGRRKEEVGSREDVVGNFDIREELRAVGGAAAPRGVVKTGVAAGAGKVAAAPSVAPADLLKGGAVVLRAFDLQMEEVGDRASQWEAVERSVRDFVSGATLLEARPPMAWASESTLAVDEEGRLHVWTLFRDGATWFALREWATEHRALLGLTRRDLRLDHGAEVAVHIVMPLDGSAEGVSRAGGRHVRWYRLRAVQWGGRRGAVVVPAE